MKSTKKTPVITFPPGIKAKDTKYPAWKSKDKAMWDLGRNGQLTFHYTPDFGWVLATLPIANSRKDFVARTYGIKVEGTPYETEHGIVTVGNGPHVSKTVTIYIRKSRVEALQKYLDLYVDGMGRAGGIRDRISTRRANTMARRRGGYGLGLWG